MKIFKPRIAGLLIIKEKTYQSEIVINKKTIIVTLSFTDDDEALLGNALLIDKIVKLKWLSEKFCGLAKVKKKNSNKLPRGFGAGCHRLPSTVSLNFHKNFQRTIKF